MSEEQRTRAAEAIRAAASALNAAIQDGAHVGISTTIDVQEARGMRFSKPVIVVKLSVEI